MNNLVTILLRVKNTKYTLFRVYKLYFLNGSMVGRNEEETEMPITDYSAIILCFYLCGEIKLRLYLLYDTFVLRNTGERNKLYLSNCIFLTRTICAGN